MATKIISQGWQLALPNSFLVDHSFSDGKQRDQTYDGPDKIFLQIGADGKEKYGPLSSWVARIFLTILVQLKP